MKIKANSVLYDFPTRPMELGEQRRVKHEFGFVPGRDELDFNDPDHLAAFLYTAIREANPDTPVNQVLAVINRTREIDIVNDDGSPLSTEVEPDVTDPIPAPASETPSAAAAPAGS